MGFNHSIVINNEHRKSWPGGASEVGKIKHDFFVVPRRYNEKGIQRGIPIAGWFMESPNPVDQLFIIIWGFPKLDGLQWKIPHDWVICRYDIPSGKLTYLWKITILNG